MREIAIQVCVRDTSLKKAHGYRDGHVEGKNGKHTATAEAVDVCRGGYTHPIRFKT